jgi:NAD(P)-dependent dehydrogenase (short-subunit alcohol dehydrogenase family)
MRESKGRNAQAALALAALPGGRVQVVELDVTSDASVNQAVATIADKTGGAIDVVVNNAGRFSMGVQEAFRLEEVKGLFETNVFGPLRVNHAALPHMRKRRSGLIVSTSSVAGRFSLPTMGTYAASKYALEALAEAQRDELAQLGIDVCIIQPGAFPTEVGSKGLYANDDSRAGDYGPVAQIPRKLGEGLGQLFSSPQAPNPQDVADAVKALIDMPAGKRPLRTVVDKLTAAPLKALNETYPKLRHELMVSFGMA